VRRIVHLSDLHFGRVEERLLDPLAERVAALDPHVVAVSGDLTQRAREIEFQQARDFLNRLPQPQIVVPGNHDLSLHNVYRRFVQPLRRYRQYIGENIEPWHADEEVIVTGINTARSLVFKNGRINILQMERAGERLRERGGDLVRIVVTHHPFDLPPEFEDRHLAGRARTAIERLALAGADVYLAGHMHLSYAGPTAFRHKIQGYAALVVQAGTAVSTRSRGESNSFNLLRVEYRRIEVERYNWRPESGRFEIARAETFHRTAEGWSGPAT
jgi:3',5'-cyclic AMP phosphodiesterase CpdA